MKQILGNISSTVPRSTVRHFKIGDGEPVRWDLIVALGKDVLWGALCSWSASTKPDLYFRFSIRTSVQSVREWTSWVVCSEITVALSQLTERMSWSQNSLSVLRKKNVWLKDMNTSKSTVNDPTQKSQQWPHLSQRKDSES